MDSTGTRLLQVLTHRMEWDNIIIDIKSVKLLID